MLNLINLCISEYRKNLSRNIMICVLLAASAVLILLTLGNIKTSYQYYAAIKPYLGENGMCLPDVYVLDKLRFSAYLKNMENVQCYKLFGSTTMYVNDKIKDLYIYDDEDTANLMPSLLEGKWEESDSEDKTVFHVLVSENNGEIKTGDIIETEYYMNNGDIRPVKAIVKGIFKNGENIAGYIQVSNIFAVSYKDFYSPFNIEQNETYLFITTEKEYRKFGDVSVTGGKLGIIRYYDDLSEEEVKDTNHELLTYISHYNGGIMGYAKLDTIKDNSEREMKKLIMKFLPFAIVVMALSIICIISASAIATMEGLYSYTVYYVTGMRWSGVLRICGFASLCNELISGIFAIMAVTVMKIRFPNIATRMNIGIIEVLIIFGMWILMFALSIIMPVSILNKNKPARLLQQKG